MPKHLLIVEPDSKFAGCLAVAAAPLAEVETAADFGTARGRLAERSYDWLVTNIRLEEYNGLQLVYLAGAVKLPARLLVYADRQDLELAREAQRAGAFFESRQRVHLALAAYLRGTLPPLDRRDPALPDRRAISRGSRRCTDLVRQDRRTFKTLSVMNS